MVRDLRRAALGALVALVIVSTAGATGGLRGRLLERSFHSGALRGSLGFEIYLPPGYDQSGVATPVVYFLHGLPASAGAFRGTGTFAEALEATGRQAILVGPQGARDGDTDPEYLDWGTGRNWGDGARTRIAAVRRRALPHAPGAARAGAGGAFGWRLRGSRSGTRSSAGRRSSRSTSARRIHVSAGRTCGFIASSGLRGYRTCSSSIAEGTRRLSGSGIANPGCGWRSSTSHVPAEPRVGFARA